MTDSLSNNVNTGKRKLNKTITKLGEEVRN